MRFLILLGFLLLPISLQAAEAPCDDAGKVYRVCADQKKIFDEAVEKAKTEKKNLLIAFGADWCPWCRSLHTLLSAEDEAKKIAGDVTFLEIGLYQEQEKVPGGWAVLDELTALYKKKVKQEGIPLLAVLNPQNKKVEFIDTAKLEKNTKVSKGHDVKKLQAALKKAQGAVK